MKKFNVLKSKEMTEEQLAECREKVSAITTDKIVELNMPCSIYLSEAELLESWSMHDKDKLATGGVTEERIAQIGIRTKVTRKYEADWLIVRRTGKDAEKEWKKFAVKANEVCSELKHAFRYAFRNDPELLGRVNEIAKGSGDPDMIQDLKTSAQLGLAHPELLRAIGFDLTKLEIASTMSDEGADLLAEANGSKLKGNELKVLRDKAYTYLKEVVDEVRACGKYIFWKDPERLVGYQSDYWKSKNSGKKKDEAPEVEA